MKYWWNDIDRGTAKYSDRTLSQCHTVLMEGPGMYWNVPECTRMYRNVPESRGQNSAIKIKCLNHEKAFQRRKLN